MISFKNITKFTSYITGKSSIDSFSGYSVDTRKYKLGDVFIAITGVNYNAFEFIEVIVNMGCADIVFSSLKKNIELKNYYKAQYPNVNFIEVNDSVSFLQELAKDHRHRLSLEGNDLKVVSISGSNGKTTCKEMLKHLCGNENIVATEKNDNNHLGVPLTLLRMDEQTQFAIIELGSNHPGEIPLLSDITQPNYAYVTNIGYTHMEFFPTLDDVFKEESAPLLKCELAFINSDDNYLSKINNEKSIVIGEDIGSFTCQHDSLNIFNEEIKNHLLVGKHNYHNLGAMIHIALKLMGDDNLEDIKKLARSFKPGLMRSEWKEINHKKVFLDAYNANPSSMVLAVEAFIYYLDSQQIDYNDAILVIGDMMELGSEAEQLHEQTAKQISKLGNIKTIFIGQYALNYQQSWDASAEMTIYQNVDEFMQNAKEHFDNTSHIFLKASRSLQFEKILDTI